MAAMPGMVMPGGWSMSMAWMRPPGQGWLAAGAAFLGMWTLMMAAMMLPVLAPPLLRYRAALGAAGVARRAAFTWLAGLGYLMAWSLAGLLLYPTGLALAEAAMRDPAVAQAAPAAFALLLLLAAILQLSPWKARALACCRELPAWRFDATGRTAWRAGLGLGWRCVLCCLPQTLALLALGIMDPGIMALVALAIAAERLAPRGERQARRVGLVLLALALWQAAAF
jgi:predicted metal-binding membrane protein